ncbi:BnaA08g29780D [Brassica napus]|uniref:BnaA08g29780D protein n=1 Tax=Brassica napus TaxID=3708 RepID=A0A078IFM1_BRANA|nr:BnaA08g29780D [Brassica napus]
MTEPELIRRKEHTSGASHLAVPENLRPPLCEEEAVGICKRVKRIHDPVKFVVPYEVFEAESPIPPDKRGLRFRVKDEVDNCPAEVPSSDINRTKSIDTIISSSIDTGQIPSIDTLRKSEQKEFEVCPNLFNGGTTMRSDKSGRKKRRNWKKRKRIKGDPQLSLIPHFSDGVKKPRVRSRCFSQPFAKLKALLIAEMIDKGEGYMEEAFTQE